ncbi:energy transducer TonB [Taibaiella chishuiensis]|uniref:TonB family protein n=1 Tax=Taibaiella chishuiensis TaxID=1434707 RepID=A0A2P8D601_9BACT|nr:energy transducer TonB [Taibaiella chishuiensis]PSK92644.1 TonB family protein [Taibaiella chishuiensis]
MKRILLFLLLTGTCYAAPAQQATSAVQREVLTTAEQMPEFPGGNAALYKFLKKNIKYPKKARREKTEGKLVVRFVVEPDGSLSNPVVVDKVGNGCEEELLRVIRKMPRWNPGREQGAFVAVYYTLPISFSF